MLAAPKADLPNRPLRRRHETGHFFTVAPVTSHASLSSGQHRKAALAHTFSRDLSWALTPIDFYECARRQRCDYVCSITSGGRCSMRQAQSEAVAGGLAFGLCGGRDCKHEFCGLWFEIMARARCSVWAWARTLTRLARKTLLPGPWRVSYQNWRLPTESCNAQGGRMAIWRYRSSLQRDAVSS